MHDATKKRNTVIGSTVAIMTAADLVLEKNKNKKSHASDRELLAFFTNAIAMKLQFNHEAHHARRLTIKKELQKENAVFSF